MSKALFVTGIAVAAVLLGSGIAFAGDFTNPPNGSGSTTCAKPDGVTVINCLDANNLLNLHDVFGSDSLGRDPIVAVTPVTSSR